MYAARALNAYSQVDLENGVTAADPHKLILMLFEGAIVAVHAARTQMLRQDYAGKGQSISKAIAIIDQGLALALDVEAGGEIARNLAALYEYMSNRLLLANLKNETAGIDEVGRLLSELKSAWEGIGKHKAPDSDDSGTMHRPASYGKA